MIEFSHYLRDPSIINLIPDKYEQAEEISYTKMGHQISASLEDDSFWYTHRKNFFFFFFQSFQVNFLLDIGGGTGDVAGFLKKHDIETIVLEPEVKGALIAREQGMTVICRRIAEANFVKNSIPALAMFDVLEHIADDLEMVRECHNLLKSDGHLFISVPAYGWLWSNLDKNSGHFRRYDRRKLKGLLEPIGFDVKFTGYIFSILPLFIFASRVLLNRSYDSAPVAERRKDHLHSKYITRFLLWLLRIELILLARGKIMPFGSTCIVVARKSKGIS